MPALPAVDSLRHMDPFRSEWVTLLLILCVAALAWMHASAPRKGRLLVKELFSMRLGRQSLRDELDLRDRTLIGLLLVASAIIGLFLWQGLHWGRGAEAPGYPMLAVVMVAVPTLQALLLQLVAAIAGTERGIREFLYTGLLLFILCGVVLLPVVALVAYHPDQRAALLRAGTALVALLLLWRWVRGAWIGLGEGLPLRYIILYLCAAEVVPVLAAIRWWWPSLTATPPH